MALICVLTNVNSFVMYVSSFYEIGTVISYILLMWTLRLDDLEKLSK